MNRGRDVVYLKRLVLGVSPANLVFALFRYGLALVPFVALRVNTKKVAAVVSLWVAAVYLLSFPRGGGLVVLLVVVVATADIGAYFSGKHWGRHKLAEVVSPKKTWEGFWGGVTACTLLALLLWSQLPDQQAHVSLAAVLVVTLAAALASVVGDLTVSMVKREAGVKDSGSLLPGHGGLLDRLDSICGAAPVLALGLLLAGW